MINKITSLGLPRRRGFRTRMLVSPAFLTICLAGASAANAKDFYIAQTPTGTGTGQNCANALSYSFFNTSANWGAGATQISPGSTVHLCGVFNAPAGASGFLRFASGGSSGNPVTLLFESGAILQAPYFGASGGAIDTAGNAFVTIDGGSGGIVRNTLNGSAGAVCPGGPCTSQQDSLAISMIDCQNCTVRNLSIASMYVHASLSDTADHGVYSLRIIDGNNVTIGPANTITDCRWCVFYAYGKQDTNLTIAGNTIANAQHGMAIGNNGGTLNGVAVHDNTIHDWTNWDDSADTNHQNALHIWAVGGGVISNFSFYNNYLYGDMGIHATAMLFIEQNGGGVISSPLVYNNIFDSTSAAHAPGNGLLYSQAGSCGLYNNVFRTATSASATIGVDLAASGCTLENNVFENIWVAVYLEAGNSLTSDFNDYFQIGNWDYRGSFEGSFAAWSSACGCDAHAITADPALNTAFQPAAGSPVIGKGTNLSGLGIPNLNLDKAGVARGAAWDMGAFAFSGGAPAVAPAPPTNLTVSIQ